MIYRIAAYCISNQLWLDEAFLADSFIENSKGECTSALWMFKTLKHYQIAPPLFLFAVNFLTAGFGTGEYVLKFLPLCASLASIPVFYILSKKSLTTKHSIILANFLYAINFTMARYSAEFKQYSVDVLFFMLALLFADKIKTINLTPVKILKYSLIFTLGVFISQPVIFILSGFCIYNFFKNPKDIKPFLIAVFPLISVLIYRFSLSKELINFMKQYWQNSFLTPDNTFDILNDNLMFFINYNPDFKFLIFFVLAGFCIFIFKKQSINKIFMFSFASIILAGVLNIYPVSARLILFLLPFFILFIAQCFDFKFKNNKKNFILSVFVTGFSVISLALFMLGIFYKKNYDKFYNISHAGTISGILKENFDQNTDNLLVTTTSNNIWEYYSKRLNFNIENKRITKINLRNDAQVDTAKNTIERNKIYWLYLPASSNRKTERYVENFLEDAEIYYHISLKSSLGTKYMLYKIIFRDKK